MGDDRGAFVVLVGPDGVGKTSVAAELIARVNGHYFHFRPPLRPRWTVPTPGETTSTPPPKTGVIRSILRMGKAFVSFWAGYLLTVRPAITAGGLVIADRWAYGYLVNPERLGTLDQPHLARLMLSTMPQPDLVFALVADPQTIHKRKNELSVQAAAEELKAWTSLPASRLIKIDAEQPIGEIVDSILNHLGTEGDSITS